MVTCKDGRWLRGEGRTSLLLQTTRGGPMVAPCARRKYYLIRRIVLERLPVAVVFYRLLHRIR